jgi:isoamylase
MTSTDGDLGSTLTAEGADFRVFSSVAERVELCLFDADGAETRIDMTAHPGFVWHAFAAGVTAGQAYGYRVHGPHAPERGVRCNPAKLLVDPYAKAISCDIVWGPAMFGYPLGGDELAREDTDSAPHAPRSYVVDDAFDWSGDARPRHAPERTVLYELHVKGFTMRHPGVPQALRGTYAGLAHPAAIASLRDLGITAVELMPVQHFAHEMHLIDQGRRNYWGYHPFGYFAPHAEYASADERGGQVHEFKTLVKALHAGGLEVILDVVYNHTAEGNHLGPTLAFKGLDNSAYYHLVDDSPQYYMDYTGTGNSLNLRHPYALQLVMDSLRYWVREMHVDGFRFDLAATLARGAHTIDTWSAFFAAIHQDPVLRDVKLIAEPWDTGTDGYQVGNFPFHWSEWNDRYRETVRAFWRGEPHVRQDLAGRLSGSADLFQLNGRPPSGSINYVASHDGQTLRDLTGGDVRLQRNLLATLLVSMGSPLLHAGDEWGRTQQGHDNAYDQDSELTWLDWDAVDAALLTFVRGLIALRPRLPWLIEDRWPGDGVTLRWLRPDGEAMSEGDWHEPGLQLALIGSGHDQDAMILLNAGAESVTWTIPPPAAGRWQILAHTGDGRLGPEDLPVGPFTTDSHSLVVLCATPTEPAS